MDNKLLLTPCRYTCEEKRVSAFKGATMQQNLNNGVIAVIISHLSLVR